MIKRLRKYLFNQKFNMEKPKLVVIVGPTGVGKTKLSLQLGQQYNGEIVNTDAIQIFKGLDIASAKATKSEQESVKHHLLGILEPIKPFTVRDYRDMATPLISEIVSRDTLPILVGGTMYYVQSLLWPSLIDEQTSADDSVGKESERNTSMKVLERKVGFADDVGLEKTVDSADDVGLGKSIALENETSTTTNACTKNVPNNTINENSVTLHEKLRQIDPEMAAIWHPNDLRKIERSLQVYDETGRKHSELIREQERAGAKEQLNYNCIVFWLTCDPAEHWDRLVSRVDKMMDMGLLEEAQTFIDQYHDVIFPLDPGHMSSTSKVTIGNMQAIGYKEFLPYFEKKGKVSQDELQLILKECVEKLKVRHRQYAKKQLRWIRNRMLPRNVPIYALDTTNCTTSEENWNIQVLQPAIAVTNALLHDTPIGSSKWIVKANVYDTVTDEEKRMNKSKLYICERCDNKEIRGQVNWEAHLKSAQHKKAGRRAKRKRLREEYEAQQQIKSSS